MQISSLNDPFVNNTILILAREGRNHLSTKENKRGKVRRNKKETETQEQDEHQDDAEEQIASHPLMDSNSNLTTIEQYEREYDGMKEMLYQQRLNAFDEDFAASQLNFIGD